MKFINSTQNDYSELEQLTNKFYPYTKEILNFNKEPTITLVSNPENAKNPLGTTANYNPQTFTITVFVDNRHPKDILRSISHELIHHAQNCRGEFDIDTLNTSEGYAQNDDHLREMEREAFEVGNLTFRDWEDHIKTELNKTSSIQEGMFSPSILRKEIKSHIMKKILTESFPKIEDIVSKQDAVRLNRIKPFVLIGGRTHQWEEWDEAEEVLRVTDPNGESESYRLQDVDDVIYDDEDINTQTLENRSHSRENQLFEILKKKWSKHF